MQNNSKKIKDRGFTLIEALVAITILIVSIAGPITIASKGIASSVFARDQITAFYLAQESIEFIRNKRDENNIKVDNWLTGLSSCLNGKVCTIDVQNGDIDNCPAGKCPVLKYDDSTGFYSYGAGDDSNFTRKVRIEEINDNEIAITSTLSWTTGFVEKTFNVKEHILDW